eukprot:9413305-Pyramimonas_sp.AAC.1
MPSKGVFYALLLRLLKPRTPGPPPAETPRSRPSHSPYSSAQPHRTFRAQCGNSRPPKSP